MDSLENSEIQRVLREYLEKTHMDEIKEYETNPIKEECIYINLENLKEDNNDLYQKFKNEPKTYLYNADKALQLLIEEKTTLSAEEAERIVVRLENYDEYVGIRSIRKEHLNHLIQIEGSISRKGEVQPILTKAHFECKKCSNGNDVKQKDLDSSETDYPSQCSGCEASSKRQFKIVPEKSEWENHQRITIQENPETSPSGETPMDVDVVINGNITGRVKPGERCKIIGIVHPILKKRQGVIKSKEAKLQIRGVSIIPEEKDYDDLEITDEDIEAIKELSKQDNLHEKFTQSISPTIKGYNDEKRGIVLQLFGGIRKNTYGTSIRGDIHILLVGDPSTGKSQILQHVGDLSPRGMYSSGKGSSAAGLTAAAIQESDYGGEYVLEAGVLPLSDKGIACVDELDKMDSKDRNSMHEALEQQRVSINKAGINTKLNTRCALLAAANPEDDRFDRRSSISEQIDLEPALVSRFDLIFIIKDEAEEEKDRTIADHILTTHQKGQKKENNDIEEEKVEPEVPTELMRKYIAYARQTVDPILTSKAKEYIKESYIDVRSGEEGDEVIPITHRKLEACIRLAEASARLRLNNEIDIKDAEIAVNLVKTSLKQTGYDTEAGRYDADKIETGQTTTEKKKNIIKKTIEELNSGEEEEATKEKIIDRCVNKGLEEEKVDEMIPDLMRKDEIYKAGDEIYKVML